MIPRVYPIAISIYDLVNLLENVLSGCVLKMGRSKNFRGKHKRVYKEENKNYS